MKEIVKIILTSSNGMCPDECGYNDEITITPNSISYSYHPGIVTDKNKAEQWSFGSTEPSFIEEYKKVAELVEKELSKDNTEVVMDIGQKTLAIIYSDGSKIKKEYEVFAWKFASIYSEIKKMVPPGKKMPVLL